MKFSVFANLHTHSTHSDGRYSPTELAHMAKREGYGAVAVTDHDVVTGYPELHDECEKLGLECILGAEFSSPSKLLSGKSQMAGEFHILGFDFDPEYPPMKEYLAGMSLRESEQTRILFERGVKLGFAMNTCGGFFSQRGNLKNQITAHILTSFSECIAMKCRRALISSRSTR